MRVARGRPLRVALVAAMCLCAGCQDGGRWSWGGKQNKPKANETADAQGQDSTDAESDSPTATQPAGRLELRFDVLRVQMPAGAVSASEKIWSHIDEDVLSFEEAGRLKRNGFRVGVAGPSDWPPLKSILDTTPQAVVLQSAVQTRNLAPLAVELRDTGEPITFFYYRNDETLTGASFPPGVLQIQIEPALTTGDVGDAVLTVVPELATEPTALRWQITPEGPKQVPVDAGRRFDELAFNVTVPQGWYLVVGPSPRVSEARLVGAAFLVDERGGQKTEWLLFITPSVVRADVEP